MRTFRDLRRRSPRSSGSAWLQRLKHEGTSQKKGDAMRDDELQRVLRAHRSGSSSWMWAKLKEYPSKSNVDFLVHLFNQQVDDISPRTYELFGNAEIRDGICDSLSCSYEDLPDRVQEHSDSDIILAFAKCWWSLIGACVVMGMVRACAGM
jgi:hypothetical protein